MIGGMVWQTQRMGRPIAWRVLTLALLGLVFAYEVRSSIMASFRNGDTPREMLVYTQSAPDVPDVAQSIERLGRDLTAFTSRNNTDPTGGHGMDIALDSTWSGRATGTSATSRRSPASRRPRPNFAPSSPIIIASAEDQGRAGLPDGRAGQVPRGALQAALVVPRG